MARIRCIKPEFPHSESMGRVSRDARLTFIQLWTLADDAGRLRGNSRMLASLLYPYDDDAKKLIEGWLRELEGERCIARYQVDGTSYVQICNWLNHQKIDKPSPSKLPAFDESSRILANPRERSSGDQDLGRDQEGNGREGNTTAATPPRKPDVSRETDGMLDFKLIYPERAGSQEWQRAARAWNARIAEGHSADEMTEGARRYAAFIDATNKRGTEYVKQAASFLGPEKHFQADWKPPPTKADIRLVANLSAADEFMRRTDHDAN